MHLEAKPVLAELDTHFIQGNGLTRNLRKLYWETVWMFRQTKPAWVRLARAFIPTNWGDLAHAYVNIYVESLRHSPYLFGHIAAFGVLVWAVLLFL